MSALDTLRAATLARRTVAMCMDGALWAEWQQVQEELADVDTTHESLAKTAVGEIVDRLEEVRGRVQASEVTFTFEGLGPWEEISLRADHPPREDSPIDNLRGFNIETYSAALVRASCVSVTSKDSPDPEPVPDEVWDSLLGKPATDDAPAIRGALNTRQMSTLIGAAQSVNEGENKVPPSARSLLESQDFGASLAQPSPGQDLPRNGSKGGSRRTSPKSSTTKTAPTKARSAAT